MTEDSLRDVCRLYLSKEGLMLPIYSDYIASDGVAFPLKIMSCAAIEVFADDGLPSKICHVCVHQVEKSFQFKTVCENSDRFLRSRLKMNEPTESEEKKEFPEENFLSVENESLPLLEIPQCARCSAAFSSYDELSDHVAEKHPGDRDGFFCTACNVPAISFEGFRTHINLFHRFKCDRCGTVFRHRKSLGDHLKTHFKEIGACRFCKRNFQSFLELKKHELDHVEKSCGFCGKERDSDTHVEICAGSYGCKFCNTDFRLKKDLVVHVVQVHDERSDFGKKCLRCREDLEEDRTEDSLCKNCREPESKEDRLSCRFCTKTFALKSSLRRHEKSHSGVKPYQCKFCPRKFKDNSTCIVHTRTHTGEHPFRCRECNKDFKQLANLKMHTYRHHKKNFVDAEPRRGGDGGDLGPVSPGSGLHGPS